jgi:hypothetical protein
MWGGFLLAVVTRYIGGSQRRFKPRRRVSGPSDRAIGFCISAKRSYGPALTCCARAYIPLGCIPLSNIVLLPNATWCGDRIEILLKILGVWTTLWLEVRRPGIYILYDCLRH